MKIRLITGVYWVLTARDTFVAGPYKLLSDAQKAYPKAVYERPGPTT